MIIIYHDGARYIKAKSWMRRIIPRKPATRASTIKERAQRINTEGLSQSILKFRVLFAARFLSQVLPRLLILLSFWSWIMSQIASKIIDSTDYIGSTKLPKNKENVWIQNYYYSDAVSNSVLCTLCTLWKYLRNFY